MLEFDYGRRASNGPQISARQRGALAIFGARRLLGFVPRGRSATAIALAILGTAATVATVALVAGSDVLAYPQLNASVRGLTVALFAQIGAYMWWRRSDSALGLRVAGLGLSFSLTALMAFDEPLPFTLGRVAVTCFVVFTAYVFVCFPGDRLGRGAPRVLIRVAALATAVVWAPTLALAPRLPEAGPVAQCSGECPPNALQFLAAPQGVTDALAVAVSAVTVAMLVGVAVVLAGKARSPKRLRSGGSVPLLWVMTATVVTYTAFWILTALDVAGTAVLAAIITAGFLAIPLGLLVAPFWGRMSAMTRLGRLVAAAADVAVTPSQAERLIAGTLGDPTLKLLLPSSGETGFVDVSGSPARLPSSDGERAVAPVTRAGRPLAALVHDRGLECSHGTKVGVALTALVLLENARLVDQLRGSRARIAAAAQQERARLERDLHDGAQQRLMGIQVKLSLARNIEDPLECDAILEEIEADAVMAVDELRTLARGIYPPLLRERGVGAALSSMVASAPVPVVVDCRGSARYSPAIEAAVYFAALEAMQNAVKHAGSQARLHLSVACTETAVSFVVADTGRGFETQRDSAGLGLVSMRDRMAAVGGALFVASTPGEGTVVSGEAHVRQRDLVRAR